MFHLGAQVYRWSAPDQIRLLRDGLGPIAVEARARGLCQRFWYTPFDARGPHVFAVFTLSGEARADGAERHALEAFVRERLEAWLVAHPSVTPVERAELDRRHAACRGKVLNAIDAQPGLAANDSTVFFAHPADGYPFRTTAGMSRAEDLWKSLEALSFWSLEHVGEAAAAIRLIAVLDRTLAAAEAPVAALWRYVATTWLVPLRDRLERAEDEVLAALPAMIGVKNSQVFERLWDAVPRVDDPPVEHAVRWVLEDGAQSPESRVRLLREIVHQALAQLLQGVQLRLPLILYAWHRNLSLASTA